MKLYNFACWLCGVGVILALSAWAMFFARMLSPYAADLLALDDVLKVAGMAVALPVMAAYLFILFDNSKEVDHV